jgi:HD-like signal output (HDOD) protein
MKILFIDDEQNILRSIQRLMIRRPYETFYVDSGKAALQFLETQSVNAVVSDMMMPEMNGYELLRKVKELYPSVARIILSGYSDAKIIQRAVMQGVATSYLLKPLEIEGLTTVLEQCNAIRERLTDESVRNTILSAGPLPVLSDRRTELLGLVETDSNAEEIAEAIEKDSAISTNMLRLANSAFYGHRSAIGSVQDAVVCIGLSTVKSVVWSLAIVDERRLGPETILRIQKVEDNSARVNRLTNALYHRLTGSAIPDTARSVGLVHDIGMFLMEVRMAAKIKELAGALATPGISPQASGEKERAVFGASHSEIGGYLLDLWSFPHICVATALYHHDPVQSHLSKDEQMLMAVLHIADRYIWQKNAGGNVLAGFGEVAGAYDITGRSRDDMRAMIDSVEAELSGGAKP